MKCYKKDLAKVITLGLLLSCGGVQYCSAVEYNKDETLSLPDGTTTYDNVIINKSDSDSNFTGIDARMAGYSKNLYVNHKISINITDTDVTNSYIGLNSRGANLNTVDGMDVTINSIADVGVTSDKYGLYNAVGDTNMGSESHINIDTKIGNVFGIYLPDDYGDNSIKGGKLTVAINQNMVDTQSSKAYGFYSGPNANTKFNFDEVNIAVQGLNEVSGMYVETEKSSGTNIFDIGKLIIDAKAISGDVFGVKTQWINSSMGNDRNSTLTVDSAQIKTEGANSACGLLIGEKFDVTVKDLAIEARANSNAVGISVIGNEYYTYSSNFKTTGNVTVKAEASNGSATGIMSDLGIDKYGKHSMNLSGNNIVVVNAKETATGILINGESGVFGNTVIEANAGDGDAYGVYTAENGNATFSNDLIINVEASDRKSAASLNANGGTISVNQNGLGKIQLIGDIFSDNGGTVDTVLGNENSFFYGSSKKDSSSKINLFFGEAAKWRMTSDSQVDDLTVGKGTVIDMSWDKGANSTLTVDNLKGSGADFIMDVNKDGHDAIIVNGKSEAGDHFIKLNVDSIDALKNLATSNKVFISTSNADTKFNIGDGFSGGLYEYSADMKSKTDASGKTEWYFDNINTRVSDTVVEMAGTNQVAYTAWVEGNGTLRQRLGELQSGADNGVWARMFGGKLGGDDFTNKYKTYQLGYDVKAGDWRVGAAYEYSDGSLNYTSGSGENKIGAVSLYGTLQGKDNSALDIVVKRGRIYGDMDIYGKYSDQGDYSTDATSIGVEYSKRFDGGNNVYFEPQAQLTFGRIDGYDYVSAKGIRVAYDDINSLIGRLGIVAGKAFSRGDVYVKASLLHEFSGNSSVAMLAANGESYSADKDYGDTWLEAGIGGNITLGKNCELYGDVERSFGGDVTKNWGANVGFRYSF